jgi:hypothetical protein
VLRVTHDWGDFVLPTVTNQKPTRLAKNKDTDTMTTRNEKMQRHLFKGFMPYSFVISNNGKAITLLNREYQPIQAIGNGERRAFFYKYEDYALHLYRKPTIKQLEAMTINDLTDHENDESIDGQYWLYHDGCQPDNVSDWASYQKRLFKLMQLCYARDY